MGRRFRFSKSDLAFAIIKTVTAPFHVLTHLSRTLETLRRLRTQDIADEYDCAIHQTVEAAVYARTTINLQEDLVKHGHYIRCRCTFGKKHRQWTLNPIDASLRRRKPVRGIDECKYDLNKTERSFILRENLVQNKQRLPGNASGAFRN